VKGALFEMSMRPTKKEDFGDADRKANSAHIEARKGLLAVEDKRTAHESETKLQKEGMKERKALNNRLELEKDR
jgi:hypothetical protein